ncbi:MAG: helix-turn-helix domain-containing protein [Chloroflexi bacterium]|nr:MAG: helix-turn-helix domain-containing protein [Chloroflexota bacterium]
MRVSLGKKIRGLRDELSMSQAQLAAQAELSQGYLSQLENDDVQNPSAAVIFRLARSLHIDPRVLMQAAGYAEIGQEEGNAGRYEVSVDPDLLSFLARIPREQQARLLKLFKGMERGATAAARPSAS